MADLDISENLINILLLILCFVFLVLLYCKYLTKRENMDGEQDLMSSLLKNSFTLYFNIFFIFAQILHYEF